MSTTSLPALFTGLVDDAAVFPPGSMPLAEAVVAHRRHREAWYRDFVGPLLLPVDSVAEVVERTAEGERPTLGLIGNVEFRGWPGTTAPDPPGVIAVPPPATPSA